jgi:hypothetical protein
MSGSASLRTRHFLLAVGVALFVIAAAAPSWAAIITTEPVDTTTQQNFVTAGYAADGYLLFNTSATTGTSGTGFYGDPLTSDNPNATTLVSQRTSIGLTVGSLSNNNFGGYGYPLIQNPTDPSGQVQTGLGGFNSNSSGSSYNLFSLSAGSAVSAVVPLRVTIISIGTAASYTLTQTTGAVTGLPTETATIADATVSPFSYYTFDITGAANGDVYTLSAVSNGNTLISGLAFSTVPEPCSLGLLSVATLCMLTRRRVRA